MPLKRKHRHTHNVRALKVMSPGWKLPTGSGTTQVGVQSVSPLDPQTLQWNFTSAVSSAPSNVPQLLASGDGSTFHAPTSVAVAGGGVQATYPSPVLSAGCVYSVTAPPTGVTFASGTLSVPQTGAVISAAELASTQDEAAELAEAITTPSLRLAGTKARKTKVKVKKPLRRAA
jgi:hypothetical protein